MNVVLAVKSKKRKFVIVYVNVWDILNIKIGNMIIHKSLVLIREILKFYIETK